MNRRTAATIACLALAAPLLQGCFTLAATGMASAALMASDRRSAGTYVEDEGIEWKFVQRLQRDNRGAHVNATSYNRRVLLTGEAPTEDERRRLEEMARGIENVREVINEIVVAGPSSITSRGNDTLITSNVKARMVGAERFSPNHVKVVTEAGTVFLLGLVTMAEADAAVDIARSTSGVNRVVKAFEYLKP